MDGKAKTVTKANSLGHFTKCAGTDIELGADALNIR